MDTSTATMERDRLSVRLLKLEDGSVAVIIMNRRTGDAIEIARGTYADAERAAIKTRDALIQASCNVGAGIWWEN